MKTSKNPKIFGNNIIIKRKIHSSLQKNIYIDKNFKSQKEYIYKTSFIEWL